MVVVLKRLYCGRNEYPFDLSPLNTDVASLVRHALALSDDRAETRSETLAISSLVARANASPPPGACVTWSSSLRSASCLTIPLDQPSPSPPAKRRSAISAFRVLPNGAGTAAPIPTASRRRGDGPASARCETELLPCATPTCRDALRPSIGFRSVVPAGGIDIAPSASTLQSGF